MPAPSPPLFPRFIVVDAQSLRLEWDAPLSDGGSAVTGYEVQLCDEVGNSCGWEPSTTPRVFRGLLIGMRYTAQVRAINASGTSLSSDAVTGSPLPIPTLARRAGQTIPLIDADRQSLIVRLADQDCKLSVWWQPSDQSWWGALEVPTNTLVVSGRRLALNIGLLDRIPGVLPGNIVLRSRGGLTGDPDRASFRLGTHALRWESDDA